MKKISIVIIEEDEKFLDAIEWKFLEEYGELAEIESISDQSYFQTYFAQPRDIDVLVVADKLYIDMVKKQNIQITFVLNEEGENVSYDDHVYGVNKYCTPNELGRHLLGIINSKMDIQSQSDEKRQTKGIFVYSPIGGCGKTMTALGLSEVLAKMGKKVLYMNLETVQTFQWYLEDQEESYEGFESCIANNETHVMSYLKQALGHEDFDYLRPIKQSTLAYGINEENYIFLIERLLDSNFYDFIVFDASSELSIFKTRLMGKCNKMLIILQQDSLSVCKVEQFLKNIDYSDENHFLYLCNNYEEDQENMILSSKYLKYCNIAEYIKKERTNGMTLKLKDIKRSNTFQTTAYLLI